MMNAAKGTSLTGYWLKQASGQGIGQTDRQQLAWHLVKVALDEALLQHGWYPPFAIMGASCA
ncbi:hypothetical protein ES703_32391 [subsurface metagenome]